ncbi:hypothetical protein QVD17_18748 [Tagetes erecta]|uniref:Secreted protein n=1 Tax=Tagetes erecta TaxID=13708 RepID=A0AAD8KPQ3_TARER|nr:hypothetical protein QVD17_18748 [Tagetes erecta]
MFKNTKCSSCCTTVLVLLRHNCFGAAAAHQNTQKPTVVAAAQDNVCCGCTTVSAAAHQEFTELVLNLLQVGLHPHTNGFKKERFVLTLYPLTLAFCYL